MADNQGSIKKKKSFLILNYNGIVTKIECRYPIEEQCRENSNEVKLSGVA